MGWPPTPAGPGGLNACEAGLGGRGGGAGGTCASSCYKGRQPALPGTAPSPPPSALRHLSAPLTAPNMGRQKELVNRCGEMLHIRYRLLRQALAECLGTLILVVSGGT